ncbi:unnamed protein product, partial [marine sediment metagenome]
MGASSAMFLPLLLEGKWGLPPYLIQESGLNSGFMITQYCSAALASENKSMCFPASADSIPTSMGQEDHVSMGSISARKALRIIYNLEKILAIELLCAAQATRKASLETLIQNGKKILNRMMEYGTTTMETKSGYGLDVENEIKSLLAAKELNLEHPMDVISTFLGAHAVPPEYEGETDDYIELIISEMIPKVAQEELAEFCDVFCEEGIFSVVQTKRILKAAMKYGLKPQIHIDEIV